MVTCFTPYAQPQAPAVCRHPAVYRARHVVSVFLSQVQEWGTVGIVCSLLGSMSFDPLLNPPAAVMASDKAVYYVCTYIQSLCPCCATNPETCFCRLLRVHSECGLQLSGGPILDLFLYR
jgi:hypothetical protein